MGVYPTPEDRFVELVHLVAGSAVSVNLVTKGGHACRKFSYGLEVLPTINLVVPFIGMYSCLGGHFVECGGLATGSGKIRT